MNESKPLLTFKLEHWSLSQLSKKPWYTNISELQTIGIHFSSEKDSAYPTTDIFLVLSSKTAYVHET